MARLGVTNSCLIFSDYVHHYSSYHSSGSSGNVHSLGCKLVGMKLAEFRYGKEEMLALFHETELEEKDPPEEYGFLKQFNLWVQKPQLPLNLQVG